MLSFSHVLSAPGCRIIKYQNFQSRLIINQSLLAVNMFTMLCTLFSYFLHNSCLFFSLFMSQARQFFLLSPSAAKNSQLYANNEPWPPLGCWCWLSTRVPHFFVPFVLSGLLNFSPVTGICYICPQRLFLAVWFKPELLHRGNTARPRVWWLWTPDHNIHISEHTEKLDISWPLPVRLYSV